MMKTFPSVILFLLVLAVSNCQAVEPKAAQSFIANGDMETDANADGWPDKWPTAKNRISWEVENGNHFLRLASAQAGEMVLYFHSIALPKDCKALTLRWRMRCSDLKPGKQPWFDARILLDFKDDQGKKLAGGPAAPYSRRNTSGWLEREISFLVPENSKTLDFMPALFQVEQGIFDLDDVQLYTTDPAPLEEAARLAAAATLAKQKKEASERRKKAAAAFQKNESLVSNGSFESAKKASDWPDDWGKSKSDIRWETEDGNHFLRLHASTPGETILLYRAIDIPEGVAALELRWRQRVSNLRPGKEPYFDARIMMEFKDEAGKKLSQKPSPPYTRNNTTGWVEKNARFLVPKSALTLELMPALFQVERGTFDLDDLVLKPIDAAPLIAAAEAAAEDLRRSTVPPEEPQHSRWPAELRVSGNQIVNSAGQRVWLQGVNVVSLEWSISGERVMKSALVAVDDWKANAIRLPVKEEYWFGRAGGQKDGGASYRKLVDQVITLVANRGSYVVLDLHRFRAPKDEHVEFWKDAATIYKNHPAVLFDLFNEPHGISWEVWRNGGFVAEQSAPMAAAAAENTFLSADEKKKSKSGFQSPGMQKLVDAVRSVGARNIVIAGGLDWAYDLSGIVQGYALSDSTGNGIVYSTHIYPWKKDWSGKVLQTAEKHPIFVGEVGADIKKMSFIPADAQEDPATWVPDMLGLIQQHHLHWTGFSFHPSASPVMIQNWDFAPTSFWGLSAKEALSGKSFSLKKKR